MTVQILNKNDNSPVFEKSSYDFSIPENNKVGDVLGNVTATDADGTPLQYTVMDDSKPRLCLV